MTIANAASASPHGGYDHGDCGADALFDQRGIDAEDVHAMEPQELTLAMAIRFRLLGCGVVAAIDLDDEPARGHVEIDDVRSQDVLSADANSELSHSDGAPEEDLAARR